MFFRGEYEFLSNFYPCEISYKGIVYPTAEHAYQAAKCLHKTDRRAIRGASTAGMAKRLGREVELIPDWNNKKIKVMMEILESKFSNPDMRKKLLATQGVPLEEENTWGDTFWGVCNGKGENNLGKLLMLIRAHLVSTTHIGDAS